jgi:hypothetical protein
MHVTACAVDVDFMGWWWWESGIARIVVKNKPRNGKKKKKMLHPAGEQAAGRRSREQAHVSASSAGCLVLNKKSPSCWPRLPFPLAGPGKAL